MKSQDFAPFVGQWRLMRTEATNGDEGVVLEFMPDGRLTYSIDLAEKKQIINLTFQVEGDQLVTDQPSKPYLERTRFWFEEPNRLVLQHGSERSWYERMKG